MRMRSFCKPSSFEGSRSLIACRPLCRPFSTAAHAPSRPLPTSPIWPPPRPPRQPPCCSLPSCSCRRQSLRAPPPVRLAACPAGAQRMARSVGTLRRRKLRRRWQRLRRRWRRLRRRESLRGASAQRTSTCSRWSGRVHSARCAWTKGLQRCSGVKHSYLLKVAGQGAFGKVSAIRGDSGFCEDMSRVRSFRKP